MVQIYKVGYCIFDSWRYKETFPIIETKYENILFKEEAEQKAKSLLNQLKYFYRIKKKKYWYTIQTYVAAQETNEVFEKYE